MVDAGSSFGRTLGSQGLPGGTFFRKKKTWFFPVTGDFIRDLFRGENVTSIWVIKRVTWKKLVSGGFETTCFFDKFQHFCETNTFFLVR